MTPFAQTLVRTTTIRHHTERGPVTTAHNARLQRKGKGGKKTTDFKEAGDLGLTLATDTLRALLENGKFPSWKELILSP